jgi:hypothetical protein
MGPGAVLELRSESMETAWPEGPTATNCCLPIHWTRATCVFGFCIAPPIAISITTSKEIRTLTGQTWQEDCEKVDERVWVATKEESKGVEGQNVGSVFCYGNRFSLWNANSVAKLGIED